MELDCLNNSSSIDNKACLELAFELSREPRRSSSTPRRGKSSSPRSYQQLSGGDFSRADSYENFERAEDERSLSLPIGICSQNLLNEDNYQKLNDEIKLLVADQPILQENLIEKNSSKSNLNKQQTQDGADSGIGSDSPKVAASQSILLNGLQQQIVEENNEKEQQQSDSEFNKITTNMPPPVPPKSSSVYKHSPLTVNDGKDVNQELNNQNLHYSPKKHSETRIMDGEGEEENDPMRSAFEDSTIGRDHSVLPPGARSSSRRYSPHASIDKDGGGTSASSGDERPRRRVIISPMVQPQLVASGRYDPNSRCFSYVPAKSLKEHYKAPKKPSLKRRTSVIEPADLEVSPLEAKMALENFGLQSCSSETYRKTETPKWEAEIDKLTGGKIEHRPRRASTAGTPVGHIQHDFVRSPSAAQQTRPPRNDWNYPQQQPQKQPQHWNWPTTKTLNYQKSNGEISNKWPNESLTTQRLSRAQMPHRDNYNTMTTSMPSSTIPFTEQPIVFEQAKRATPTLLQQQQSTDTRRRPIPGVRPSPRRSEMDALCDPEFYLSYSTPTASPILNKKYPLKEKNIERKLSKSVPDGKEFNQMAKNELQRDDVKELLAQHLIGNNNKGNFNSSVRRSQTPQNPLITSKELEKPLKMDDDYRARNCRSVNSTPLIRNRRLFLYKDVDEPSTDPECAEDWLHSKLQALKGRREPIARNKKEAEKLLLEELKNKATKLISKENEGDPLEEYKKEEQRLKNTKSPFNTEIDGLRKANKFLQNERAKQNFFKQNPSFISSTISKSLPSTNEFFATQRSLSAAPGINNNNNFNGQSQHFGNLNSDSPIPQANVKRGATPTGQIISSKPPTPPPNIRGDYRERSKSPHNSKLILKNSSKKSFEELEPSTSSSLNNSAVNPNLLALRQSLYAKERQRMGLPLNGNVNELINYENNIDEDEFVSSIETQKKKKWALPGLTKNTESNFQQQDNLVNNQQLTNVKPILKRGTQQQQQLNNGTESPILNNKKQFSEDLTTSNNYQKQQFNNNNWSLERSDTPQFPLVSDRETPLPYHPLLYKSDDSSHKLIFTKNISQSTIPANRIGNLTPQSMYGLGQGNGFGRRASLNSIDSADVIHHHPIFVKDTSRFWYKPKISREEAISMLKNKPPGTFVVRDSNSFPGAFGLALKVAQPPAGVVPADGSELVRHFLIEPSPKGVRLKGCSNEPVFGTLAALVYQHSITPLALPCRLILPSIDPATTPESINSNQALLERGAACNVTYLCSVDTESLTGPEAVRRSTAFVLKLLLRHELRAVPIHIKVSVQGITLTDNTRTLFFRRHYPVNSVTFAGIDPENRVFDNNNVIQLPPTYVRQAPIFGFVAHKIPVNGNVENSCHMFAELDPDQPASAVVRFITNVMMPAGRVQLQQRHQQQQNNNSNNLH